MKSQKGASFFVARHAECGQQKTREVTYTDVHRLYMSQCKMCGTDTPAMVITSLPGVPDLCGLSVRSSAGKTVQRCCVL